MLKIHLTISGVPKAMACAPSAILPKARSTSGAAQLGSIVHGFLSRVPIVGREEALFELPVEHRAACEAIDVSKLPACRPDAYSVELAVAYNVLTGEARILKDVQNRQYPPLEEGWLCGTEDVVGLTDDAVITLDYKSGWGDLTRARSHHQVRTYGLAFARALGRPRAVVGLIRGFMGGGDPWWDVAELDEMELAAQEYQLEMLWRRLVEARKQMEDGTWDGSTCIGEHCSRCDSLPFCPAYQVLARQVVLAGDGDVTPLAPGFCGKLELVGSHLNEANARQFLERIQAAQRTLDTLKDVVDTYARHTPIALDDGYVYGPRPWPTEKIDPRLAEPILREGLREKAPNGEEVVWCEGHGKDFADACMHQPPVEIRKCDLDAALKTVAKRTPGMKWSKEKDRVLEALRRSGASRLTFSYPVGEHRPKPQAAAPAAAPAPEPKAPKPTGEYLGKVNGDAASDELDAAIAND